MDYTNVSSTCWFSGLLFGVIWWLVASAALYYTYNRVIVDLFGFKRMKQFWHALLVVLTIGIFCAPQMCSRTCKASMWRGMGDKPMQMHQ